MSFGNQGFAPAFAGLPTTPAPFPTQGPAVLLTVGPDPNATSEPETFIVQNTLGGPLCIADIRLNFTPGEIKNLTWYPPAYTKGSQDLAEGLRKKWLRRITKEQWQTMKEREERRDQARAMQARQNAIARGKMRNMAFSDGTTMEVDVVNANQFGGGAAYSDMIAAVNLANDPRTYAEAQDAWNTYQMGGNGDPADFRVMVQKNPNLVIKYAQIGAQQNPNANPDLPNMAFSGDARQGRAYVNTPNQGDGYGSGVTAMQMTNINRDERLAGSQFQGQRQAANYGQNTAPDFNNPQFAGIEFPDADGVQIHKGNYDPFDTDGGLSANLYGNGDNGADPYGNDLYNDPSQVTAHQGLPAYDPDSYANDGEDAFGEAIDLNDDGGFSGQGGYGGGAGGAGRHPLRRN